MINKDTLFFGSFSINPGNNGTIFFNNKFNENNINAVYKSFYSNNITDSFNAAKTLSFGGFAVSMPFKFEIVNLVDKVESPVEKIGAANTVLFLKNKSIAYNTDWIAAKDYLGKINNIDILLIAGNGGFSKAIQYACKQLNLNYQIIDRQNWDKINSTKHYIFNATPVDLGSGENIIDGRPHTKSGKIIAETQAQLQYEIYSQLF